MTTDLDPVDACPTADRCESCAGVDDLDTATAATPVGVYCLTLCGPCAEAGNVPSPGGWVAAVDRVAAHCLHLGIDADQMAQLMKEETDDRT